MPEPTTAAPRITASHLALAIESYARACGLDPQRTLFRISQGAEQHLVLAHGTTRAGKSDMAWDRSALVRPEDMPRWPIRHEDVLIASTLDDLKEDAALEDEGTLAHKLRIYPHPFVSFHDRDAFLLLLNENAIGDAKNRGRHWLFRGDRRSALRGIADILVEDASRPLRQVPLAGGARPDAGELAAGPRRFYFALTNRCNRACPLCCCHSDPGRRTDLPYAAFDRWISCGEPYEAQLEGGEPLMHPDFDRIVERLAGDPLCVRIVLCTNSVLLPLADTPAAAVARRAWLERFLPKPFVLKPSANAHLIERDGELLAKLGRLRASFDALPWKAGSSLRVNVRRRLTEPDGDAWITAALAAAGLAEIANDFIFQRIGRAEDQTALPRPFIIPNPVRFSLIAPDGTDFGDDLVGRADHMAGLA